MRHGRYGGQTLTVRAGAEARPRSAVNATGEMSERRLPDASARCRTHRPAAGRIGPLPDAMDPGIHGVRTPWIRGFKTFQLARRTRIVRLMVPA